MSWWGKLMGGAFGFMLGGPLGALLGATLGHQFDKGYRAVGGSIPPGARERVQLVFFTATFAVMGRLAKADGRVSEDEIHAARQVMQQMGLHGDMQDAAMRLFTEGKHPDFDLDGVLDQFKHECRGRRNLVRMFIEIQLHVAYADGDVHREERELLEHLCARLGFSATEFRMLEAMVRAAGQFHGEGRAAPQRAGASLQDAYRVLGVDANATDAQVKTAYRRLMNQHHPDKLVAKGLPEEMMRMATEKAQEIRAAYETIKEARKSV